MTDCIYCPNPAGSDEHIIASRFVEVLAQDPRGLPLPAHLQMIDMSGQTREIGGKMRKRTGGSKKPRDRRPTIEFKTRVCTTCNNRWMNDIDSAAFPKVAAMIRGERTFLSRSEQTAVASWVAKVAVTARFAHLMPDHVEQT